jgi:hypothetical protein
MPRCDSCGNDYDKVMEITQQGRRHVFDSFECAIHMMAPKCTHCGCSIIGHGVEDEGRMFCCAACARKAGIRAVRGA